MKFILESVPVSAEKLENGKLRVYYKKATGES